MSRIYSVLCVISALLTPAFSIANDVATGVETQARELSAAAQGQRAKARRRGVELRARSGVDRKTAVGDAPGGGGSGGCGGASASYTDLGQPLVFESAGAN